MDLFFMVLPFVSYHGFCQERRALLAELLWGPGPPLLEIMRL